MRFVGEATWLGGLFWVIALVYFLAFLGRMAGGVDTRRRRARKRVCGACAQERRYRRRGYSPSRASRLSHTCRMTRVQLRERRDGQAAEWRKLNPEKLQHYARMRRARVRGAPGSFTRREWEDLLARTPKCPRCRRRWTSIRPPAGRTSPVTVDHVMPLSRGGSNDISNIQPMCHRCNSSKGAR